MGVLPPTPLEKVYGYKVCLDDNWCFIYKSYISFWELWNRKMTSKQSHVYLMLLKTQSWTSNLKICLMSEMGLCTLHNALLLCGLNLGLFKMINWIIKFSSYSKVLSYVQLYTNYLCTIYIQLYKKSFFSFLMKRRHTI